MKRPRILVIWAVLVCLSAVLVPGRPELPGVFAVQGGPGEAGVPRRPGLPEMPGELGEPGVPGVPKESGEPGVPGVPKEPGKPEAPWIPGKPGAPSEPQTPGVPAPPEDQFTAFREAMMNLPVKCEPVTLVAVGDIMLSRGVADRIKEHGDPGLPFAKVKGLLDSGDIVFGNLECPLTPGRAIDIREMVLRADPEMADALASAGFTLLSLANNHMGDFGPSGIVDTLGYLDEAGISWVGAGPDEKAAYAPRIVEVRGLRFAFLPYPDSEIAPPSYQAGKEAPGTASISVGARPVEATQELDTAPAHAAHAAHSVESTPTAFSAHTSVPHHTIDAAEVALTAHIAHAAPTADEVLVSNTVTVHSITKTQMAHVAQSPSEVDGPHAAHPAGASKTPGTDMLEAIKSARLAADFVVVSLHAGTEYADEPDAYQIESARAAIDAGADLVIGHHPHVVQRVECYRGRYILYSLGNFVFDQWWSRETRQGVIARITIGQEGIDKMEFVPVLINQDAQPEVLAGSEASEVLSRLDLDLSELAIGSLYDPSPEGADAARYAYLDLVTGGAPLCRLAKERSFDLDQDGVVERVALRDGRLTVETASALIWETPETWWVDDFALGDANNDGVVEVNMSVWKSGSFDPCKPFWVSEDDPSVRNHLFIFKLVDGAMKPVWQSSNLDSPICELEVVDLDGDGQAELLVLEGDYDDPEFRRMSIWKWNDWGFFRVSDAVYRRSD